MAALRSIDQLMELRELEASREACIVNLRALIEKFPHSPARANYHSALALLEGARRLEA